VKGYGYEITAPDVRMAYSVTMKAAEALDRAAETTERIRQLIAAGPRADFVARVLRQELGVAR
jgi:hypothetical protein